MISIKRYLNQRSAVAAVEPQPDPPQAVYDLAMGFFDQFSVHLATVGILEDLHGQMEELRARLRPGMSKPDADELLRAVSRVMAQQRLAYLQSGTRNAAEIQHIVGMLHLALMSITGGSERSRERLSKVEHSLRRAQRIQDIVALKESLSETVRFVQEESAREQQHSAREVEGLKTDFELSLTALGKLHADLPGRQEGVATIQEMLGNLPPRHRLYLIGYRFDQLVAVAERYGPEAGDALVLRLFKERVQPVAPEGATFRWTPASLVTLFTRPRCPQELQEKMSELNQKPLLHRLELGNRAATLTLAAAHLVAESMPEDPENLLNEVDRFTGVLR